MKMTIWFEPHDDPNICGHSHAMFRRMFKVRTRENPEKFYGYLLVCRIKLPLWYEAYKFRFCETWWDAGTGNHTLALEIRGPDRYENPSHKPIDLEMPLIKNAMQDFAGIISPVIAKLPDMKDVFDYEPGKYKGVKHE